MNIQTRNGGRVVHTDHGAASVLDASDVPNIRSNPQEHREHILRRVDLWVETSNNRNACAVVDLSANFLKLRAEGRQWEVLLGDCVAVQSKCCHSY